MFILTRPLPKLAQSQQAFDAADVPCTVVATTTIELCHDNILQLPELLSALGHGDAVIVTSVYAVPSFVDTAKYLHSQSHVVAIGDATANTLKKALPNTIVHTPDVHSSEGILTMQQLDVDKCQQVVIIKGMGGRALITSTLSQRGIAVSECNVYRRVDLHPPNSTNKWKIDDVSGIIATSEHLAFGLLTTFSELKNKPWLTVSERIASALRHHGIKDVHVSNGATDDALIASIKDNWEY